VIGFSRWQAFDISVAEKFVAGYQFFGKNFEALLYLARPR